MALSKFMEGLNTLRPYYDDPEGRHVGAANDLVFAWATDKRMSKDDAAKMFALGWFQSCGRGASYDPKDGWNFHT